MCAGLLGAQPVSFGVKGGLHVRSDLDSFYDFSESKRYTVGPMVTAWLPFGFRLEFDALYSRVGFRRSFSDILGGSYTQRDTGNAWEFPIIVRRTLWHGIYGGVGYAPRVINGSGHINALSITSINPPIKTYSSYGIPGSWETTHGVVGVAGIEKRFGPLRIAPEIRYTHWNQPSINVNSIHDLSIYTRQDQVDFLIGIRFP
jgi:hypothetical protein